MQILQRKVPVDGGLQFRGVEPFGHADDLANPDEAPIADNACQKGFFWWLGARILDVPRLKGCQKAGKTVDRREHFNEGDVVLIGEKAMQRLLLLRRGLGRGEMERTVFVAMAMRIGPLDDVLIGPMILLVELLSSRVDRLLAVDDCQQVSAVQIVVSLGVPRGFGDEIILQRPVFIGVREVHSPRLNRLGNFDEQQGFVQRDTHLAGRVHDQTLCIGLQEGHGCGRRDGALLVLIILQGREEIGRAIAVELELFDDVGDAILAIFVQPPKM